MKIQMLTNGVDSLKTGFKAFLKYEENTVNKTPTQEDYLILKHAVLSVHHGVEILMKCVLTKQSEFLIVSRIDEDYLKAYQNKVQQNKNSVFETALADKVHIDYYLTHEIFACVNVQGLGYWNFGKFLMRTKGKDGQWVKVNMRQIEK